MRILNITAQKPHSTGSGFYLTETIREFAAIGHSQAVVAGIYDSDKVSFPSDVEFYPVYFNTPALPFPIAGMSDEMPYTSTRYRDMNEEMVQQFEAAFTRVLFDPVETFKPDVIICHHLYLLAALTRRLFPDLPLWGICHGTDLRQMYTNPLRRESIREAVASLDKVCCLHDEHRQAVISCYGIDPQRVKIVGSGFNHHIFFDSNKKEPHDEVRLVYAGKISEKKGVYSLIAALDELGWQREDFSLRMAGGWSCDDQCQQIEKIIAESGWDVTLLGALSQTTLAKEFNQGDIFVLPSFFEGLPLVLAESMACGMKAVCTDLPGIRSWMDANVPGHGIRFVQMPDICIVDSPAPECLPQFQHRLASAIREAAAPRADKPDLSALSWQAVCQKILK